LLLNIREMSVFGRERGERGCLKPPPNSKVSRVQREGRAGSGWLKWYPKERWRREGGSKGIGWLKYHPSEREVSEGARQGGGWLNFPQIERYEREGGRWLIGLSKSPKIVPMERYVREVRKRRRKIV
jgi:hypothetical protein